MIDFSIGAAQLEEFRANGFIALRNAIPRERVTRVRDALARIVGVVADRVGISVAKGADSEFLIDSVLPEIYRRSPGTGGFVYDTINAHASTMSLFARPTISRIAASLLAVDEDEIVEHVPSFIVHIKGEKRNLNGWHQESGYYAYFLSPAKSISFWIPASRITADRGALWVVPGSHLHGVLPHAFNEFGKHKDREWDRNGEAYLETSEFEIEKAVQVGGEPGDVIAFDIGLVHKSGFNSGPQTRLTGVLRMGSYTGRAYLPKYDIVIA